MSKLLMLAAIIVSVALQESDVKDKNILSNANVEEGGQNPTDWSRGAGVPGVEYTWDKNVGHDGKGSLCLHKTAQTYFPIAQWLQTVERTGEINKIEITAQVKADKVTKAVVDVLFLDEQGEWVSHEWVAYIGPKNDGGRPTSHDWKKYSGQVEIPENTQKIQIGLQIYGPGKVWFDEINAVYVEPKPAKPEYETRTWTDSSGQFSVEAVFVKLNDDQVTVKRTDNGEEVTLGLSQLSEKCREYVRSLKK